MRRSHNRIKKSSSQINKLEINPPQKKRIITAMIKKLSKIQIIIIFAILERIKGTTEIELILSRLNKIENNQKLIIGTIRKQRGQIQQLDAALQIKQVNKVIFIQLIVSTLRVCTERWSTSSFCLIICVKLSRTRLGCIMRQPAF